MPNALGQGRPRKPNWQRLAPQPGRANDVLGGDGGAAARRELAYLAVPDPDNPDRPGNLLADVGRRYLLRLAESPQSAALTAADCQAAYLAAVALSQAVLDPAEMAAPSQVFLKISERLLCDPRARRSAGIELAAAGADHSGADNLHLLADYSDGMD